MRWAAAIFLLSTAVSAYSGPQALQSWAKYSSKLRPIRRQRKCFTTAGENGEEIESCITDFVDDDMPRKKAPVPAIRVAAASAIAAAIVTAPALASRPGMPARLVTAADHAVPSTVTAQTQQATRT